MRLVLALLIGLFAACGNTNAEPPLPVRFFQALEQGREQTVVLYGTSLTANGEWTKALRTWLDEQYPARVRVVNSAGPGMNSTWGLENVEAKVLRFAPDLVFIEFSYNDAHDKFLLTVPQAAENLERIVGRIRERVSSAEIVLQTMNAGWDAPNGNRSASVRPQLEAFNAVYRDYAAGHGLPIIDHYETWARLKREDYRRFENYVPDGSHPTAEASLAVTWPAVKALLTRAQAAARVSGGR